MLNTNNGVNLDINMLSSILVEATFFSFSLNFSSRFARAVLILCRRGVIGHSRLCWLRKGEINVAGPVQHPHDLNATGNGEIKDDVMVDRKAA